LRRGPVTLRLRAAQAAARRRLAPQLIPEPRPEQLLSAARHQSAGPIALAAAATPTTHRGSSSHALSRGTAGRRQQLMAAESQRHHLVRPLVRRQQQVPFRAMGQSRHILALRGETAVAAGTSVTPPVTQTACPKKAAATALSAPQINCTARYHAGGRRDGSSSTSSFQRRVSNIPGRSLGGAAATPVAPWITHVASARAAQRGCCNGSHRLQRTFGQPSRSPPMTTAMAPVALRSSRGACSCGVAGRR
jgi:hypothetical protein